MGQLQYISKLRLQMTENRKAARALRFTKSVPPAFAARCPRAAFITSRNGPYHITFWRKVWILSKKYLRAKPLKTWLKLLTNLNKMDILMDEIG
jgi:hypothetical protein